MNGSDEVVSYCTYNKHLSYLCTLFVIFDLFHLHLSRYRRVSHHVLLIFHYFGEVMSYNTTPLSIPFISSSPIVLLFANGI